MTLKLARWGAWITACMVENVMVCQLHDIQLIRSRLQQQTAPWFLLLGSGVLLDWIAQTDGETSHFEEVVTLQKLHPAFWKPFFHIVSLLGKVFLGPQSLALFLRASVKPSACLLSGSSVKTMMKLPSPVGCVQCAEWECGDNKNKHMFALQPLSSVTCGSFWIQQVFARYFVFSRRSCSPRLLDFFLCGIVMWAHTPHRRLSTLMKPNGNFRWRRADFCLGNKVNSRLSFLHIPPFHWR